jgi:hypothetical protein
MFIVAEVIMYAVQYELNYTYSAEYQQFVFTLRMLETVEII